MRFFIGLSQVVFIMSQNPKPPNYSHGSYNEIHIEIRRCEYLKFTHQNTSSQDEIHIEIRFGLHFRH